METFVVQAEADTLNDGTGQPSGDRWEVEAENVESATAAVRAELDADPERTGWRIVYAVPLEVWRGWQDA
jgi:hypothetical protein